MVRELQKKFEYLSWSPYSNSFLRNCGLDFFRQGLIRKLYTCGGAFDLKTIYFDPCSGFALIR